MLQPPWCFRKLGGKTHIKQNRIALIDTVLMKYEALSRARHHFEQTENPARGEKQTAKSRFAVLTRSVDRKAKTLTSAARAMTDRP
jgi:hypothetical protein